MTVNVRLSLLLVHLGYAKWTLRLLADCDHFFLRNLNVNFMHCCHAALAITPHLALFEL